MTTIKTHKDSKDSTRYPDSTSGGHWAFVSVGGKSDKYRAYIAFDITSAPAVVSSVHIWMKLTNDTPEDISAEFKRIVDEWDEDTLSYNNAPAVTDTNNYEHILPAAEGSQWESYDITKLYEDAKSDGIELGVRISSSDDDRHSYIARDKQYSNEEAYIVIESAVPPTISDISWSPKGEFVAVSSGAALVGATEELKVITLNHTAYPDLIDEGEAYLERIDLEGNSLSKFAVAEYDHFRFDNEEWWALNIICGPECDIVTFANETAEALKTPKIGDEIQFACNINWHGAEPDRVEWYYAKAPNRCFTHEEAAGLWELFASEQLPTHTFEAEDDHEITFLKVLAKNANGDISELGDTCRPVFNLWKYKPSWWDSLLASVRTANDEIATPITALFTGGKMKGWTTPPFECPICEQVFEGEGSELEYAEHLMSHIKAFEGG